ncbi:hypothetical protein [Prosthecobacter sp.]|uniref:hypothetical protein n=1 Tax=Prosthecobacter sp. TaxID=1965333 RepID=UPI0037834F28
MTTPTTPNRNNPTQPPGSNTPASSGRRILGCGCFVIVIALYLTISMVRFAFPSGGPPPERPGHAAPPNLLLKYAGVFISDTGKARVEINAEKKSFSFYTTVSGRQLLQTEMVPVEVRVLDDAGQVIELLGDDHQAGGAPAARVRITRTSEAGSFKLERVRPVGGILGDFHKQQP